MVTLALLTALTADPGVGPYERGDYPAAVEAFARALTDAPGDARLDFDLGSALYKAGRFAEADKAFARAARDPQLEARALYDQGNARFKQDDFKGAIESYQGALQTDPRDEDAKANLVLAQKKLEQKQQLQQKQDQQKQDDANEQKQDQSPQQQQQQQQQEEQQKPQRDKDQNSPDQKTNPAGARQPTDQKAAEADAVKKREHSKTDPSVMSDAQAARILERVDEKRPHPQKRRVRSRSGKDW